MNLLPPWGDRAGRLAILAHVCGLSHDERLRRHLAMFMAHIDDSGGDGKSPVFVMGGPVAPVENWLAFTDEWDAVLAEHPRLPHLKMVEAASPDKGADNPFAGWSEDTVRRKVRRLKGVMETHASFTVGCVIPIKACRRAFVGNFSAYLDGSPEVFLAASGVFQVALKHMMERKPVDQVSFVFDSQTAGHRTEIFDHWSRIGQHHPECRPYMGATPTWNDDTKTKPLQAADLVAWSLRRFSADGLTGTMQSRAWDLIGEEPKLPTSIFLFRPEQMIGYARDLKLMMFPVPFEDRKSLRRRRKAMQRLPHSDPDA